MLVWNVAQWHKSNRLPSGFVVISRLYWKVTLWRTGFISFTAGVARTRCLFPDRSIITQMWKKPLIVPRHSPAEPHLFPSEATERGDERKSNCDKCLFWRKSLTAVKLIFGSVLQTQHSAWNFTHPTHYFIHFPHKAKFNGRQRSYY